MNLAKRTAIFAAILIGAELFLLLPFVVLSSSESGTEVLMVAAFAGLVALFGAGAIALWRRTQKRGASR